MGNRLLNEAAASVDATPAIVPVLSDLFKGLDSLGSAPGPAVAMLRQAGIGPASRLLDLGCGKGAFAVTAALRLKCRCLGVDALPDFVRSAQTFARRKEVEKSCRFVTGNARTFRSHTRFDAAAMLGLFGVSDAARLLRRQVRPGGVFILDDAVAVSKTSSPRWVTIREAREILTAQGDEVIAEDVWTPARVRASEGRLYERLSVNVERLAVQHPELTRSLVAFLHRQRQAAASLRGPLRPVVWMVRVRQ